MFCSCFQGPTRKNVAEMKRTLPIVYGTANALGFKAIVGTKSIAIMRHTKPIPRQMPNPYRR